MTVGSNGRITLPSQFRDQYHIEEGGEIKLGFIDYNPPEGSLNLGLQKFLDGRLVTMDKFEQNLEDEKDIQDDELTAYRKALERTRLELEEELDQHDY
jgi:bifunctional DNA-binding transcriptional regulator/antitoxin component of YhaV-PrlF toxin-antitoxin module